MTILESETETNSASLKVVDEEFCDVAREPVISEPSKSARCRIDVLGTGVDVLDLDRAVRRIESWIEQGSAQYVTVTGVHGVMEGVKDDAFRRAINRAGMVTPDGMPMVWLARWSGHRDARRVYGPDLMLEVCRAGVAHGWRHYFYGGKEGVAAELAETLQRRFPGLQVAGYECPPFRALSDEEDREVCERIMGSRAHLVWVGLGAPKQERWMASHVGRLGDSVLVGVGAAFDFHTGRVKQAPSWMQSAGLEWLFRLIQEPKRLWRRYLSNNPAFMARVAGRPFGFGRYGSIDDFLDGTGE